MLNRILCAATALAVLAGPAYAAGETETAPPAGAYKKVSDLGRVLIKSTLGVGEPNVRLSPNSGAKADIQPLRLTRETSQIT